MERIVELVLCILASSAMVEVLRHGSNFQWLRRWGYDHVESRWRIIRLPAKLAVCAFCQSHWTSALAVFGMFYATRWLRPSAAELAWFLVTAFAVTRAANLLNDLTRNYCRSPRDEVEEEDRTSEVDGFEVDED